MSLVDVVFCIPHGGLLAVGCFQGLKFVHIQRVISEGRSRDLPGAWGMDHTGAEAGEQERMQVSLTWCSSEKRQEGEKRFLELPPLSRAAQESRNRNRSWSMLSSTSHMVQQQDREEPKQEPFLMDHRELEAREEASFKLNVKDRLAMHFGNGSRCEGPGSRSRNGCRKQHRAAT